MKDNKNVLAGIKWGVIIGLLYVVILYYRWNTANNFMKFGLISFFGFAIVLAAMFIEASQVRKLNGGYIEIKLLFKTLFISVLIFEFLYALYNFIHLTYIDPNVVERMKEGMQEMMDKFGDNVKDSDREKALAKFDEMKKATELPRLIKGYLSSVAMSGVFALLVAAIMKKKKPVFAENI